MKVFEPHYQVSVASVMMLSLKPGHLVSRRGPSAHLGFRITRKRSDVRLDDCMSVSNQHQQMGAREELKKVLKIVYQGCFGDQSLRRLARSGLLAKLPNSFFFAADLYFSQERDQTLSNAMAQQFVVANKRRS